MQGLGEEEYFGLWAATVLPKRDGGWMWDVGDQNIVFQVRRGEILLNQAVIRMSQTRGQLEHMI